jgi:hypothetical protein
MKYKQIVTACARSTSDNYGREGYIENLNKLSKYMTSLQNILKPTTSYNVLSLLYHFKNTDNDDAIVIIHDEKVQRLKNNITAALVCKEMRDNPIQIILFPSMRTYTREEWINGTNKSTRVRQTRSR